MDAENNLETPEQEIELLEDDFVEVVDLDGDDETEEVGLAVGMEDVGFTDDMNDQDGENVGMTEKDNADLCFQKHTASVFSVAIEPVNSSVGVSGGEDDKAYIWQITDGQTLLECHGHKDSVTCTAFSHDGKFVATGDMSGFIIVWDVVTKKEVWNFEATDLEWLEWHNEANVLLAGTADGNVWMWKIPGSYCKTFQGHGCRSTCGIFMKDGKRASVGYEDGTLKLWDLRQGMHTFHLSDGTAHQGSVTCIDGHRDNVLVATGSEDSTVKIVNTNSGKVLSTLAAGFQSENDSDPPPSIEAVGFSPQQPMLATASLSGVLGVWDLSSYRLRQECKHPGGIVRLKWDSVTPLIYTGCLDGVVRLWDSRSGNCEREWYGHSGEILDLAVARDGSFLITGSGDSTARLFTVQTPGR
ncbi:Angio-associated migratory cell protein [Stylophora pistillata]|uniref:Angio-associated migratory cell protein n=2 Tax=Stylophora pistillata TaxID=50429 RepID=A0A2B4SJ03_STYPI|nr:Angio-associated migratory cell protein [Stylophora pistillata]